MRILQNVTKLFADLRKDSLRETIVEEILINAIRLRIFLECNSHHFETSK